MRIYIFFNPNEYLCSYKIKFEELKVKFTGTVKLAVWTLSFFALEIRFRD